jgi:hypothetical protein
VISIGHRAGQQFSSRHSNFTKQRIPHALRCLGDIFVYQDNEETALVLFAVALDGFERMDAHCGKADRMLRLRDISMRREDLAEARSLYRKALALFERSSQAKSIASIEARLQAASGLNTSYSNDCRYVDNYEKFMSHLTSLEYGHHGDQMLIRSAVVVFM